MTGWGFAVAVRNLLHLCGSVSSSNTEPRFTEQDHRMPNAFVSCRVKAFVFSWCSYVVCDHRRLCPAEHSLLTLRKFCGR